MSRDLDTLLTSEMTDEEWAEYRKRWIKQRRTDRVTEMGHDPADPHLDDLAGIDFERYCGQEGWTARDERISESRG